MTGLSDTPGSVSSSARRQPENRPDASDLDASDLVAQLEAAASEFRNRIAALSDADVRAPSGLPDWSRGHVLAHVAGVANGMARQLDFASRGETVELYDGGVDGRNRAIEEGAVLDADRHRTELASALDRALVAFRGLQDSDWTRPISYRNGVVRDGGLALWRELVIHLTDLQVGIAADSWSPMFCEHLFGFLSARVPSGIRLRVQPFGMAPRTLESVSGNVSDNSTARTVFVNGMATDIAAWLSGRTPNLGSLRAEAAADGVELPTLLPWPSALPAK